MTFTKKKSNATSSVRNILLVYFCASCPCSNLLTDFFFCTSCTVSYRLDFFCFTGSFPKKTVSVSGFEPFHFPLIIQHNLRLELNLVESVPSFSSVLFRSFDASQGCPNSWLKRRLCTHGAPPLFFELLIHLCLRNKSPEAAAYLNSTNLLQENTSFISSVVNFIVSSGSYVFRHIVLHYSATKIKWNKNPGKDMRICTL